LNKKPELDGDPKKVVLFQQSQCRKDRKRHRGFTWWKYPAWERDRTRFAEPVPVAARAGCGGTVADPTRFDLTRFDLTRFDLTRSQTDTVST
jgi:hypothetical protein